MRYGLSEKTINELMSVFNNHNKISEVILYGSRAKGNYTEGSDIDLTIKGSELNSSDLYKIDNDIDDLLLPYLIDISIYSELKSQDLIDHINRVGITIYSK